MNKKEYQLLIEHLSKTLEEVLTYDIITRVKSNYGSPEEYESAYKRFLNHNNFELKRFTDRFHFDTNYYGTVLGGFKVIVDGKQHRFIKDVVDLVKKSKSSKLIFVGKRDVVYQSGKDFHHQSFIVLDPRFAVEVFTNESLSNPKSKTYSIEARRAIFEGLNLYKRNMKELNMTKAQKEQYNKEYAEGKHLLTLEEYIKDEAKKRRRADRHRMSIAKKAAKQTMKEYASMAIELEKAKAEIDRLKSCKDIDSDIPADVENIPDDCITLEEAKANEDKLADELDYDKQIAGMNDLLMNFDELEDKKPANTQDDDIPPDYDDELVRMLSDLTKKHYISANSANLYASWCLVKCDRFKESATGYCVSEGQTLNALKAKEKLYRFMLEHYKYELSSSKEHFDSKVRTSLSAVLFKLTSTSKNRRTENAIFSRV